MKEKQEGHPNLNRGGNEGNAFGAGRKRNSLREKFIDLADREAVKLAEQILTNPDFLYPAYKKDGTEYMRKATLIDKRWAAEFAAKYGLSVQVGIGEDGEGKPILVVDM